MVAIEDVKRERLRWNNLKNCLCAILELDEDYTPILSEDNLFLARKRGVIAESIQDRRLIARKEGILFNSVEDLAKKHHGIEEVTIKDYSLLHNIEEFIARFSLKNGTPIEAYECKACGGIVKGSPFSYSGPYNDKNELHGIWLICRICYSTVGGWPHT